jgi:glycosyltransferase involved in cell wall biosynthesis
VRDRVARALFVNSGILGHKTVAGLMRDATAHLSRIEASHLDLSDELRWSDRAVRRLFSLRLAPGRGVVANIDLRRWREELNVGLLAARRIASLERRSGRFALLHFHTQAAAYGSLRRMRRTPSIVSIDCTQQLARREADSAVGRATYLPNVVHDSCVFNRAAAIIATSRWAAADLAAEHPSCARKVHVMPYPVRMCFGESIVHERELRWRGDQGRRAQVLFVGGDFPRKGGLDLLAVWRAGGFAARADLTLVTDWPIGASALPDGVRVIRGVASHSTEWVDLWRSADLFVMPSRSEAFGVVFQEAAAAGLPVVATRINAVPEIVADGETGLLVPPANPEALVTAMRTLIDSVDLRHTMGRAARARIGRTTPAVYADRLQTVIGGILETYDLHAA